MVGKEADHVLNACSDLVERDDLTHAGLNHGLDAFR